MDMSISAWPSIEPSRPFSASWSASSTRLCFRKSRNASARMTIISGPPTNSPRTNCHPSSSQMMIPSSITRFVEANSKAIAAVKFAPLRNSDRARATEAYEQEDDAAPRPEATRRVFGESSGSRRRISRLETTAWTTAESAKPRISAQRTSHVIPKANESAWTTSLPMLATTRREPLAGLEQAPDGRHQLRGLLVALVRPCRRAIANVGVDESEGDLLDRGLHRGDLREDVDAVAVFLDNARHAAYLTFDARQPLQKRILVRRVPSNRVL